MWAKWTTAAAAAAAAVTAVATAEEYISTRALQAPPEIKAYGL